MPTELWTKLLADAPILAVLLIVLWRGGEKFDKLGEKLDKFSEKFDKMILAVKGLSSKVELVGKLQDARLELHEERSGTAKHPSSSSNGAPKQPSWPDTPPEDE